MTAPDERVLKAYRAASDQLDEQPAAATRAAILAAAARAVEAGPRLAGTAPVRRWRLPLAAAATVLVSTVAVMLAQRSAQEMPALTMDESVPRADGSPSGAVSPPAAAVPAPAAPQVVAEAGAEKRSGLRVREAQRSPPAADKDEVIATDARTAPALAKENAGKIVAQTAPALTQDAAATADTIAKGAATSQPAETDAAAVQTEAARVGAKPESAKAAEPAPVARADGPTEDAGTFRSGPVLASRQRDATERTLARREAMPSAAPAAPAVAAAPAPTVAAAPAAAGAAAAAGSVVDAAADLPPERWIARIIELRRAGRDEDADRELKALRDRFPAFVVPPAVLPAGARATR